MSHRTTYTTSLKNVASIKSLTKKAYEKYSSNNFSDDNLTSDRNGTFFSSSSSICIICMS